MLGAEEALDPGDRPFPKSFEDWRGKLLAAAEGNATPGEAARKTLAPVSEASADVEALLQQVDAGELDKLRARRARSTQKPSKRPLSDESWLALGAMVVVVAFIALLMWFRYNSPRSSDPPPQGPPQMLVARTLMRISSAAGRGMAFSTRVRPGAGSLLMTAGIDSPEDASREVIVVVPASTSEAFGGVLLSMGRGLRPG